jgi:putative membrane protein
MYSTNSLKAADYMYSTNSNNKTGGKLMKKIISLVLTIVLMFLYAVPAAAAETPSRKEEVIYGILNPDGSVKNLYVVNVFEGGDITDYGDYTDVRNMTTTEQLVKQDDKITVVTKAEKFYYQGYLDKKDLPWNIDIKYYLNDMQITADKLAGKSGKLKITLSITRNTAVQQSFYENYALQAAITLSSKLCSNIVTDGKGAIAEAGGKKQISLTVLPGNPFEASVTADVHDFEMDAITINAIRMNLDLDVDSSAFSGQISELTKAAGELDTGAGELLEGLKQLADGMNEYTEGLRAYRNGIRQFADGFGDLSDGIGAIDLGLKELASQNDTLNGGAMALQQAAFDAVNAQLAGMGLGLPSLTPDNYSQLLSSIPNLVPVKLQLDGVMQFTQGLKAYTDAVAQLSKGASGAAGGASAIKSSLSELYASADTLYGAASDLNTAVKSLRDGLASYKEGTQQFKDSTSGMDTDIDEQIDKLLSEITGSDGEVVSFVSDKNTNITSVQFVLKTTPISILKAPAVVEPEPVRLNFWQRILKLFGLYKD